MHSPTLRLLAVLELLQSYPKLSGAEIARRLEVDVRTVRRYITLLQDMGIPVEAERGAHGAYHLQRGRRLPPMLFHDEEAIAIALGLLAIRTFGFPVQAAAVESALAKLERVLPQNLLDQVRSLQAAITFNVSAGGLSPVSPIDNDLLVDLSTAVRQGRRVHLHYRAAAGALTERDFDPYGIVYNDGYWYTAGHCHLRGGLRTLRLDRVTALAVSDEPFERPRGFDGLEYVLRSIAESGAYEVELLLETSPEQAERVFPPIMGTLHAAEGGVLFRRTTSHLEWIAWALLEADFPVVIRQPDELRQMVAVMGERARAAVLRGADG